MELPAWPQSRKRDCLWCQLSVQIYLLFVPVEALVFIMVDGGLVALVLSQVGSFVQNFFRLQRVAGHSLDHPVHDVSQHLPNLSATDSC